MDHELLKYELVEDVEEVKKGICACGEDDVMARRCFCSRLLILWEPT